mmetsp:Transcript_20156/g.17851  ORF Transcript_20156/g.17851 Transcript_20156/m.17851 type:complete len:263 (-) Transcript_20156:17-805(-)
MAAEKFYNCPRCNKKVSAVSPLRGAVCLECNNVSHWQPTMVQIASAMRNESDPAKMMTVATEMLQGAGIYQQFMTLYGAHLMMMSSIASPSAHKTQVHQSQNSHKSRKSNQGQSNSIGNAKQKETKQKKDSNDAEKKVADNECWIYSQTTGVLKYGEKEITGKTKGYSGVGDGLNNPDKEDVGFVGPIPRGKWKIGKVDTSKGAITIHLDPVGHNAKKRYAFRIHGDNGDMNKSASEGCIILPKDIREKISLSNCKTLIVVR